MVTGLFKQLVIKSMITQVQNFMLLSKSIILIEACTYEIIVLVVRTATRSFVPDPRQDWIENGPLLRQAVEPLDCSSVDALNIKPLFCRAVESLLHEVSSRRPEHNL